MKTQNLQKTLTSDVLREHTLKAISLGYSPAHARAIDRQVRTLKSQTQRDDFYWKIFRDIAATSEEGRVRYEVCHSSFVEHDKLPVDIQQFLEDRFYLGLKGEVYPIIMDHAIEINSGKYDEAVLTGAIGTAKTTLALWTTAYQLYLLSLLPDPQLTYGLDHSSEIVFIFQSISAQLAKAVDFGRFQELIRRSPYFSGDTPFVYDKDLTSELRFPKRIVVKPVSGQQTAAIGQNVFGGVIDEVNYMAKVEKSKQSVDSGTYDQATALYNSISRRRKSRFMRKGKVPGVLCIVSSKRYPGQFTDIKEEEARREIAETGSSSIYIYDKRTWEVLPEDRFSGAWFQVFIGDESRQPRILEDEEVTTMRGGEDDSLLLDVPLEYKQEFQTDIMEALREIGGVSTLARHPYFSDREKVAKAFGKTDSVLSRDACDFVRTKLQLYNNKIQNHEKPRWVHFDLALTGDCAGAACGYVDEFVNVDRDGFVEKMPSIVLDFTLRVSAPPGSEIQFHKLRKILYLLRDEFLMNIRWVSFDGFQSADMIQILRTKGFTCGQISMDKDEVAYNITKSAFYDERVSIPKDPHAQREFLQLERDVEKSKIDHPPSGSKDVSDSIAGVITGLTMRREVWALHNVPPHMIPATLNGTMDKRVKMRAANVDELESAV